MLSARNLNVLSTRNLGLLPGIPELRRRCQSIAMLDAILSPEWEYRYYSFNSQWDENEEMASMRDGSGDSYFILFSSQGAIIKGYAHNSRMGDYAEESGRPWPGVLSDVPSEFNDFLAEPAFSIEETSFCIWRSMSDSFWRIGDIDFPNANYPDGSADLLYILDGDPLIYQEWSEGHYERSVRIDLVEAIYQHHPLTQDLIAGLNPHLTIDSLSDDIKEIGYP